MKHPYRLTLSAALLAGLWAANPAGAQTVPATPTDNTGNQVVTLSPFEVTSTHDTGYAATQTLAGTRIRTNLSDVGASIQVLTKEFLNDIGATGNDSLLQYTTNAEVAGTRGTYAGVGNGATYSEESNLIAPQGAQRIRGLAPADNARNYYITDIPWDSYNVSRIDILRGPNSILFGLGSPSGIINATTHNAEFRNFGSVAARTGSYGSLRGSVDLNQQIVPEVLSLRVDGLWDDRKYQEDPAFNNDKRIYGALRFDPQLFKRRDFHTSIKANIEHGEVNSNNPRILPPNDAFTPWWRPVAISASNPFGGMGQATFNNVYDPYRTDNVVAGNGMGTLQSSTVNFLPWAGDVVNQQQPFYQMDGASGQLYQAFAGYINNGFRDSNGNILSVSNGPTGQRRNGMLYEVSGYMPGVVNNYNQWNNTLFTDAKYGQYRNQVLMDPSVFDFYNTLIDGPSPNKNEWQHWNAYDIDLSQTAFDNRIAVEFTYDRQKYTRGGESMFGWNPSLTIDLTKQFADLSPNPNFGRPFITAGGTNSGSSYSSDRKFKRGSLFAELRPSDLTSNSFLLKLFGKQEFNGVAADEQYFNENRTWQLYATPQSWDGYWNRNAGNTSSLNNRPPVAVVYLGQSVVGRSSASGANVPGVQTTLTIPNANVRAFDSTWTNFGVGFGDPWNVPSSLYTVYDGMPAPGSTTQLTQSSNPANYKGWNNDYYLSLLRSERGNNQTMLTTAQKSLRETTSYSGSWQGFFWNNALVTTFGWRYDKVQTKDVTAQANTNNRNILNMSPDVYRLPDTFPAINTYKGHSTSGGVVLHLNRILNHDYLPLNLSLTYNESSNFQVTSVRRDLYGNPISNPSGKTYEYGLLLATKDDKYSLRVTKFTTRVMNGNSTLGSASTIGGTIANGLMWRNIFLYQLGGYDWGSRNQDSYRNRWTNAYPNDPNAQADEDSAINTWNDIQKYLTAKGFFKAWNFTPTTESALTDRTTYLSDPTKYAPDPTTVAYYGVTQPQGFAVTANTESKGYEYELVANPLPNWRIEFNASDTTSTQTNVGGKELADFVAYLNSKLVNPDGTLTPAGQLPRYGNPGFAIYPSIWGPWLANYTLLKLTEGSPVPEIRKWRYNTVMNYEFDRGLLKGTGIGGAYRWEGKVIIGYPVKTGGSFAGYDLSKPYYGPAEDALDLWVSYHRMLTKKIGWKIQLNVYNVGKRNKLIPISVEPDGHTWAAARMSPVQEWQLTNTFTF